MQPLTWLVSVGLLASAGKVINFDTAPIGQMPPGWSVAMTNQGPAPRWEIRRDQTAPTQPYVLAQTSNDRHTNRFPLAILDTMNMQDGDISVRFKPVAGREDLGGGLVWRYRDANNYYLVHADAVEKQIRVFKVQNGHRTQLGPGVRHEIPANDWSILKVSMRGKRFQIYVDHRRMMQGEDATFTNAGRVGLSTEADSVTYFDDFRIYPR